MLTKRQPSQQNYLQSALLIAVVLSLVLGSLALAIIDQSFRPSFAELAKIAVAGYIGSLIPRPLTGT